jgi:hypothetical protein
MVLPGVNMRDYEEASAQDQTSLSIIVCVSSKKSFHLSVPSFFKCIKDVE